MSLFSQIVSAPSGSERGVVRSPVGGLVLGFTHAPRLLVQWGLFVQQSPGYQTRDGLHVSSACRAHGQRDSRGRSARRRTVY